MSLIAIEDVHFYTQLNMCFVDRIICPFNTNFDFVSNFGCGKTFWHVFATELMDPFETICCKCGYSSTSNMTCMPITLRLCCVFEKRSQLDQNCKTLPNMGLSWFRSLQVNNFRLDWNDKWQRMNHGWHCQQGNKQKEKHE